MTKREDLDRHLEELLEMATNVLGDVEDLDRAELGQMLEVSGPSGDELAQALYRKLKSTVEDMRKAGRPVPERYREVLEQVRPFSEPTQDPRRMQSRARVWVEKLLREVSGPAKTEVAVAFRNKSELSRDDQVILERAAEKLKERLQKRGKK
jgi:hypothetical protein